MMPKPDTKALPTAMIGAPRRESRKRPRKKPPTAAPSVRSVMPKKMADWLQPRSACMGTERTAVDQMAPAVVKARKNTTATITQPKKIGRRACHGSLGASSGPGVVKGVP